MHGPFTLLQSIMDHNGGSVVAMAGKDCVAIASDLRLGAGAMTVAMNFEKVSLVCHCYRISLRYARTRVGLSCHRQDILGTHGFGYGHHNSVRAFVAISRRVWLFMTSTFSRDRFRYLVNMFTIKESRAIEPSTFAHLVSSTLYSRRFGPYFTEPVLAGLERTPSGGFKPYIAGADLIGCLNFAEDFIVAGTASDKLFGVAEGLWEPDLGPEDLFETISQTLLNSVDRDAYSGWGAIVHVM